MRFSALSGGSFLFHSLTSSRLLARTAAIAAAILVTTLALPTSTAFAAETANVNVTKRNDLGGKPLKPGDDVNYNLYLSCSSIEVDCLNYTFEDTLPAELTLDPASLPASTDTRVVSYDSGTRVLSIVYTQSLDNPAGAGLPAGSNETFDIKMTLPSNTPLTDGATVSNSATVKADNAEPTTATNAIAVSVPIVVTPVATKSWTGPAAVAGSKSASTVQLGIRNASSSSADVRSLAVTDSGKDTFDRFDVASANLVSFPPGADQARLFVCTDASFECADGAYVEGGSLTAAGAFMFPAGIDPGEVTGVRVVFSNAAGTVISPSATAGRVDLALVLRDTIRSTGETQRPVSRLTISNCATPTATDASGATTTGASVCASKDIFPDTLTIDVTKTFFPDTNQNFTNSSGEYAVVGQNSPVSALVQAVNSSSFPVQEITITEPAATVASEFDKFDTDVVRLYFPQGAATGRVVISYSDGSSSDTTYSASTTLTDVIRAGLRITQVEVTYRGADNGPTIEAASTARLGLSGRLNDLVTDADLPSGSSPGVDNCARVAGSAGREDGTGASTANVCRNLPVEAPRSSSTGVKSVARASIPEGEPIPFTLRYTNNGNMPLVNATITDPAVDSSDRPVSVGNPFNTLRITSASVSKTSGTDAATIQVFDPAADGWVTFVASDAALLERASGIRVILSGELLPTQYFQLNLGTERRDGIADGVVVNNCFVRTADGYAGPSPSCSPAISTAPAADGGTVNKTITPSVLPRHVPGLPTQYATVNLTMRNTGNLSARELGIEDVDRDFFDDVDFVNFSSLTFPASSGVSNRVRIDALVDDVWVLGTPASQAALPTGVRASDVTGIRATFSNTSTANGGHVFTPCSVSSCEGRIAFRVTPRLTTRSDSDVAVESPMENTASGFYATRLQQPGTHETTDGVTSALQLNNGTPKLDVDKTPDAQIAPGESSPFTLKVTNTGTSNIPNLRVVDALPTGLAFDEEFNGDGGEPYRITSTNIPAGTPPVPTPVFELLRDGQHVSEASFDFGSWVFAPGATISIVVRVRLEPGVVANQQITNTMAAGSDISGLICEAGDGTSSDKKFGAGTYCTDTATARTRAGASFEARKWVSGNPALGWYNARSGQNLPVNDASCPSFTENNVTYTATPCIALVNPGDRFDYLVRVLNAGTEPGTQMTIVDRLPVEGDTGVLGAPRGTQWDQRPTLIAAPVVSGGGQSSAIGYSTSDTLCTEDLDFGSPNTCSSEDWATTFTSDATAFQVAMNFRQAPLAPGAGVSIAFSMRTPLDVSRVSDPTIAWNSVAHAETTMQTNGRDRILAPIEPIKVGVATSYGSLQLEKTLGENPAQVTTDGLEYTFTYECTITPQGGEAVVAASGHEDLAAGEKHIVRGLPAGADCAVWETSDQGAVSGHKSPETARHVTIAPHFGAGETDPSTLPTATIENSYPMGILRVTKVVTGDAAAYGTGPFSVRVSCSYNDQVVTGFPRTLTFNGAGTTDVAAPVGARCTTTETVDGGATTSRISPVTPVVIPAEKSVDPADEPNEVYLATVDVTNRFDAGSLVINKELSGVGVPTARDRDFVFHVACSFNGVADVFETEVTLSARDGARNVTSAAITGLPLGAECTITETDDGGADSTPEPVTVVISADDTTDNTVTAGFVNDYSAGVVELTKLVDGALSGERFVTDATFTVFVTCQIPMRNEDDSPVRATLFEGDVEITAGETTRLEGVLLPVDARCFGEETETGGATASSVSPSTFEDATPVVAGSSDEVQVLDIVAVNTFDAAELSVTKRVINGTDASTAYSFELQCTTTDASGTAHPVPVVDSDGRFTLRADETRVFTVLAGSLCTVTETDVPAAATVTISDDESSTGSLTDGIVLAGGENVITVTNTFPVPPAGSKGDSLSTTGSDLLGGATRVSLFLLLAGALLLALRKRREAREGF